ncbi:MAG: helix-turn-helix transcriptional regulator [Coriobacteriales bacterium]|nr:helix-turn-helix transcriptional regulator [Coriobacteriales bacterium]
MLDDKIKRIGKGTRGLLRRLRGYLDRALLSLCVFQAWIFLVFHSSRIIPVGKVSFNLIYVVTLAFAVLTLLTFGLISYRRKGRIYMLIFAAFAASASMLCICFLSLSITGFAIGAAFLGISTGIFISFVGKILSSVNFQAATHQVFLSFAFAAAIYFLVQALSIPFDAILIVLLPFALTAIILSSAIVARRRPHVPSPHSVTPAQTLAQDKVSELLRTRPIMAFIGSVSILGMAFGFNLTGISSYDTETFRFANYWAVLLTAIAAIAYFTISHSPKHSFSFERYFAPVMPIIILGLLLFPYSPVIANVFAITGFQLADMSFWVVFAWVASHPGMPQRAFCVGKGSMYLGMLIGSAAMGATLTGSNGGTLQVTISSIVTYLLVLAVVFIFNNSKVNLAIKSASRQSDLEHISRSIELRCDELGQKYGLTLREKELCAYLAQGRNLPYIEKKMYISHGTANVHRDHIYAKLGIHSRQELVDFFFEP